jgi:hypothetical protein
MRRLRGAAGTALAGALVLVASLAHLLALGRAPTTLDTNLATPAAGAFRRTIELVHPSPDPGRAYLLTLAGGDEDWVVDGVPATVRVQLWTAGRTRLVLVRPGHGDASRLGALRAWLSGDAALRVVNHRGWLDLGPAPGPGETLRVRAIGLLPDAFSFVLPERDDDGAFASAQVVRVDGAPRIVAASAPRYRIVAPAVAGPREVLARLLFFPAESPPLAAAAAAAGIALALGWMGLARRPRAAVCALVAGVVLLRAALLPPLQGADETSHVGTIEHVGCCGSKLSDPFGELPRPIVRLAEAIDQNRVQHHRDEPMPVVGEDARRETRERLAAIASEGEPARPADMPAGAAVQPPAMRAPAYYEILGGLWPAMAEMSVLDRVAVYRLASAIATVALWCIGALALGRAAGGEQVLLLYAAIPLLVPMMVEVMATTSNYAPATGLGAAIGGVAVAGVLAAAARERAAAVVLVSIAALFGTRLWADDWLLAGALAAGGMLAAGWALVRRFAGAGLAAAVCAVAAVAGGIAAMLRVFTGERVGGLYLPDRGSAEMLLMVGLPLAPLAWAGVAAAMAFRSRGLSIAARRRRALRLGAIGLAVAVAGFLATPFTTVPYETAWLELPALVRAYVGAFLSTNFAFDQDTLSWKLYWGAFGWHDAFYPPVVYAVARWSLVVAFLALPVLSVRFAVERAGASAALVLLSGIGVAFCLVSELIRQVNMVHPVGRYLMPWLTLAALPLLARVQAPGRERWLRLLVRFGVALEVWTTIAIVGGRYAFGTG